MSASSDLIHLAVALDGTGWHPASWRDAQARPGDLLTAGYWADLVGVAERGLLDFVTFEDRLGSDQRTDRVRGRLDAVLIASRVAPLSRHIGLIPTVFATHTEPFHLSKAIATLDYVSSGRAGVQVRVAPGHVAAALFGRRRDLEPGEQLLAEAGDYIEVLRRLWDSWEDDAEIRDVASGRFIDRNKLHYIDFDGPWFSVKGPSITPRPPQGQPIVAALAHNETAYRLAAEAADIAFVTPHSAAETTAVVDTIAAARAGGVDPVRVFVDLVVFLADTADAAAARRARLDELGDAEFTSDADIFTGTPAKLADLLQSLQSAGATGFRLRPATLPHDLSQITEGLVPELQRRGAFRDRYETTTLRQSLGLARPANRYSAAS
ncbi:LLM class flavin-dependent oxidoreductase [soil metagenome]